MNFMVWFLPSVRDVTATGIVSTPYQAQFLFLISSLARSVNTAGDAKRMTTTRNCPGLKSEYVISPFFIELAAHIPQYNITPQ